MKAQITKLLVYVGLLVATGLGFKACSQSKEVVVPTAVAVARQPTTTPLPPLPTPIPPTDTPVPPTDTPAPPTDTPEPATATAEPTEETASAGSENCVACHTSAETLQALAEDKTVKSEATEGEG